MLYYLLEAEKKAIKYQYFGQGKTEFGQGDVLLATLKLKSTSLSVDFSI